MGRAIVAAIWAGVLLAAGAAATGWYFAGEIERAALAINPPPPPFDLVVTEVGDDKITLRPSEAIERHHSSWQKPGRFGIVSAMGDGAVGDIVRRVGEAVTRDLISFNSGVAVGDSVRLRAISFAGDPLSVHGLEFDEVVFESDIGRFGAWYVPASSSTWAIFVHGRAAGREEGLTVLPTLAALGLPTLVIQYRNDEGVARSASGFYDYGLTEWRDLEAAVRYALAQGATNVVLIGNSMGGSIVVSFLYRSDLADRVLGVVLDSPLLDFGNVIDFGGERRNIWRPLIWLGKTVATYRSNLSWHDLNYLERADELAVPILLFHGDADGIVHVRKSDALAAARPDIVTFVRLDDVGHVQGWNVDRDAYEHVLADFLETLLAEEPRSESGR